MNHPTRLGKILRIAGIILLGLTAMFNLLGGIGSTCISFAGAKFAAESESMAKLLPYAWLYQLFVVFTIPAALYAAYATIQVVRNRPGAYRKALLAILACLILAAIQMTASHLLRGKSQPNDMRVYISLLALIVFLIFRLPGMWQQTGFGQPGGDGNGIAAGLAMFLAGVMVLTVPQWAAPTHTFSSGINYADAWHTQLTWLGALLVGGSTLPFIKYLRAGPLTSSLSTTRRLAESD